MAASDNREDRISSLPNDIIHHILSSINIRLAVQTCVLSKQWKLTWTTLPFLEFTTYEDAYDGWFIYKFFINRLNLSFQCTPDTFVSTCLEYKIKYAISHNVRDLTLSIKGYELCPKWLNSSHLRKLILKLDFSEFLEPYCWNLPALTTLQLIQCRGVTCKLPESYLLCFRSLENLVLDGFELPISVSLPVLTTLRLSSCKMPMNFWDFPALLTLTLHKLVFSDDMSEFFIALANLRNLTLFLRKRLLTDCYINCPRLVDLKIDTCMSTPSKHQGQIIVLSQKICKFCAVGFLTITFTEFELESANIKLRDKKYKTIAAWKKMKNCSPRVTPMFLGVSSAKFLTLHSEIIEALSGLFCPFSFSISKTWSM